MPAQRMLSNLFATAAAGVFACAVVGCSSTPSSPTTPGTSSSPTSASSGSSSSVISSAPDASATSTESSRPTALVGKLAEGVESGCVVLIDDTGTVLANLIGLDPASAPIGSTVEVNGQFEPDLMTTCQQGDPFSVASVEVR